MKQNWNASTIHTNVWIQLLENLVHMVNWVGKEQVSLQLQNVKDCKIIIEGQYLIIRAKLEMLFGLASYTPCQLMRLPCVTDANPHGAGTGKQRKMVWHQRVTMSMEPVLRQKRLAKCSLYHRMSSDSLLQRMQHWGTQNANECLNSFGQGVPKLYLLAKAEWRRQPAWLFQHSKKVLLPYYL